MGQDGLNVVEGGEGATKLGATWTVVASADREGAEDGEEAAGEAEVEAEEAVAAAEVDEVGTDAAAAVEGRDDDDWGIRGQLFCPIISLSTRNQLRLTLIIPSIYTY